MIDSTRNVCRLTERQVDDDVVRAEVAGDIALVVDEERSGRALRTEIAGDISNLQPLAHKPHPPSAQPRLRPLPTVAITITAQGDEGAKLIFVALRTMKFGYSPKHRC